MFAFKIEPIKLQSGIKKQCQLRKAVLLFFLERISLRSDGSKLGLKDRPNINGKTEPKMVGMVI